MGKTKAEEKREANDLEKSLLALTSKRRSSQQEENKLLWARYYNTLAKSHASQARRYEALCDELLPIGDE